MTGEADGGAEALGAGVHVAEPVTALAPGGGVKAGAVVLHEEADFAVAVVDAQGDERGAAVAQGVADGFARDLEGVDRLFRGEEAGGGVVDFHVEPDGAAGAEFAEEPFERVRKTAAVKAVGGQAGDIGADVADGAVESGPALVDAAVGLGRILRQEGPRGLERETDGVEGLDDAVVEVVAETDFVGDGLGEEMLFEIGIFFGAPADVALAREFGPLGDRGLGQFGEGIDFGAGGGERRLGFAAACGAAGETDDENHGEDEAGEGEREGEALRQGGGARNRESGWGGGGGPGGARRESGGGLRVGARPGGYGEQRGERRQDDEKGEAQKARQRVHAITGANLPAGRRRVKTFDIRPAGRSVVRLAMKSFYITTAIDYVNGSPHLGHAYEKVLTDTIARFRRQMGDRVHFLTGVDEHGQKVQASAKKKGIPPQQFCDEVSAEFRALLPKLNITNDDFIRTTEERHKTVVRAVLQQLFDKGEIYQAEYKGFYSTRQEQFLQEKDRLPDGTWPELFGEVTEIVESNYFFKLKQYQEWLVEFLTKNETFIFPAYRQKQVLEFLKEPLNDLCISRPRERLEWGIPLPFDDGYVTYVWFDALLNYYSAVADRPEIWAEAHHVIGKDILVPPHAVYWPIMLKAAGISLPKGIIAHGWWMTRGAKMSKSTGNALNPLDLVTEFGADAFRYFLIREMNVGQDSDFTREQFLVRYNSELANNLGNLVNRTLNMTTRFAGGVVPAAEVEEDLEKSLRDLWTKTRDEFLPLCEGYQFHTALERAMVFLTETNAYIEKRAPWKLGKSTEAKDAALLRTSLATMAEALRLAVAIIQHITPTTTEKINAVLGYTPGAVWRDELNWGGKLTGAKVAGALVLFPRPAPPEKTAAPA